MQTSETDILNRVRGFIRDNFLYMHSNFELKDDDRLLEKGVMDSMSIVEMIMFIAILIFGLAYAWGRKVLDWV